MSDETPNTVPHSGRVVQAAEMVSAQANCSLDEALAMMSDRADANVGTLDAIAEAVLHRIIRFAS